MEDFEIHSKMQFWANSLKKFKNVPNILSRNTQFIFTQIGLPKFKMISSDKEMDFFFTPLQNKIREEIVKIEDNKYFVFGEHPYLERKEYYSAININTEEIFNINLQSEELPEFVNSSIWKFLLFLTELKKFILFIEEKTEGNSEGEMYFLSDDYKNFKNCLIEIDEEALMPGTYWYQVNLLIQYYYADYI